MTHNPPTTESPGRRLTFRVDDQKHALESSQIFEIIRVPHITRVPNSPDALVGLMNLQGKPVAVFSMSALLHGHQSQVPPDGRIIVYDHHGPVGLLVDEVWRLSDETTLNLVDGLPLRLDGVFKNASAPKTGRQTKQAENVPRTGTIEFLALLAFRVNGQLYGMDLRSVREVSTFRQEVSVVDNAIPALLGFTPYRGGTLPLACLNGLLGHGIHHDRKSAAVYIVIEHQSRLIGLVVDELDKIIRIPLKAIDSVPNVLQKGRTEAKIEAVGRIAQTGNLISILSPARLFEHQVITKVVSQHTEADALEEIDQRGSEVEKFLIFQLGGEIFGLPVKSVDEVIRVTGSITRVPGAPEFINGLINLRGRALPLIDQRLRFGNSAFVAGGNNRAIVLTLGDLQAGFIVDAVLEVKAISAASVSMAPEFTTSHTDVFDRVAQIEADGKMILLISPEQLLTQSERDIVATATDAQKMAVEM